MNALPKMYTVEEAAAAMHHTVSEKAIRAAIAKKELAAIKPGKRYLIPHHALFEYMSCPDASCRPGSTGDRKPDAGSSKMVTLSSTQDALAAAVTNLRKLHKKR